MMTNREQAKINWHQWLDRWDAQQTGYLPDREERFNAMLDVLEFSQSGPFVALDLACGPGSISQRVLTRFPQARCVALDLDPVLLTLGQNALGDMDGRLRWVEADLTQSDWVEHLGETQLDAVLSTTALHWLAPEHLTLVFRQLGKLMREGGVFLNGDNMGFHSYLPTFDKVATQWNERQQINAFTERGVENWEVWWRALGEEPGMQDLLDERQRRFEPLRRERDKVGMTGVDFYPSALREAGFREVGIIWQNMDNFIVMAVR